MIDSEERPSSHLITETVSLLDGGPFVHLTTDNGRLSKALSSVATAVGRNGEYAKTWFNARVRLLFGSIEDGLSVLQQYELASVGEEGPNHLRRKSFGFELPFVLISRSIENNKFSVVVDAQSIASNMPKLIRGFESLPVDTQIVLYKRVMEEVTKYSVLYPLTETNRLEERLRIKTASGKFTFGLSFGALLHSIFYSTGVTVAMRGDSNLAQTLLAIMVIPGGYAIISGLKHFRDAQAFRKMIEEDEKTIKVISSIPPTNIYDFQVEK